MFETVTITKSVSETTGAQANEEVNIIRTLSFVFNEDVTKLLSLVPAGFPFTVQEKTGVLPAFAASALKTIVSPLQNMFEGLTESKTVGLTDGEITAIK